MESDVLRCGNSFPVQAVHHEELLAALGDFRGKVSGVLDALQAQSPAYELLKDAAAVGYLRRLREQKKKQAHSCP